MALKNPDNKFSQHITNRANSSASVVKNYSLECLRRILVLSLPSENVSDDDKKKVLKFQRTFGKERRLVDKELRLKQIKEKQNEERQRKLEEIKAQEIASMKLREEIEQGRRKRLEELKIREDLRRQQVEERKRAINEAERDRLEFILKRNQEREARLDARKRNERSNIVFAFGSSTPRMLDPTDHQATFWGHRRATSTQNITSMTTSLTRRQSERDLDSGSKKRATSASGLERSCESIVPSTPAGCVSGYMGRRRTDLMPTIPSRDSPFSGSRRSLAQSPASSRPSSALSQQSTTSVSSSVSVRHRPSTTRKPRPASIAVTGISQDLKNASLDGKKGETKPPIPKTRKPVTQNSRAPSRSKTSSCESTPKNIASPTNPTNPVLTNKNVINEEIKTEKKAAEVKTIVGMTTEEKPAECLISKPDVKLKTEDVENKIEEQALTEESAVIVNEVEPTSAPEIINTPSNNKQMNKIIQEQTDETASPVQEIDTNKIIDLDRKDPPKAKKIEEINSKPVEPVINGKDENEKDDESMKENNEMTTSMTKPRITTEEEAKAALAERRRIAREEAERAAEQERLRIEREAREELERQQREEEAQRLLIEQQRAAEQERLQEAIREAQKREEEEKVKREEEQRQRQVKEEAERKAREENERQKAELQERLKNEEKEREARRKRVEAIMLRTRGKNANTQSQDSQNSEDKNENKSENQINGSKSLEKENGTTKNSKDIEIVDNDNIIPDESVKNANNVSINSSDSINSNNSWQTTQQYDSVM